MQKTNLDSKSSNKKSLPEKETCSKKFGLQESSSLTSNPFCKTDNTYCDIKEHRSHSKSLLLPLLVESSLKNVDRSLLRTKDSARKAHVNGREKKSGNVNLSNKASRQNLKNKAGSSSEVQPTKGMKAVITITSEKWSVHNKTNGTVDTKGSLISVNQIKKSFIIDLNKHKDIKFDIECSMKEKDSNFSLNYINSRGTPTKLDVGSISESIKENIEKIEVKTNTKRKTNLDLAKNSAKIQEKNKLNIKSVEKVETFENRKYRIVFHSTLHCSKDHYQYKVECKDIPDLDKSIPGKDHQTIHPSDLNFSTNFRSKIPAHISLHVVIENHNFNRCIEKSKPEETNNTEEKHPSLHVTLDECIIEHEASETDVSKHEATETVIKSVLLNEKNVTSTSFETPVISQNIQYEEIDVEIQPKDYETVSVQIVNNNEEILQNEYSFQKEEIRTSENIIIESNISSLKEMLNESLNEKELIYKDKSLVILESENICNPSNIDNAFTDETKHLEKQNKKDQTEHSFADKEFKDNISIENDLPENSSPKVICEDGSVTNKKTVDEYHTMITEKDLSMSHETSRNDICNKGNESDTNLDLESIRKQNEFQVEEQKSEEKSNTYVDKNLEQKKTSGSINQVLNQERKLMIEEKDKMASEKFVESNKIVLEVETDVKDFKNEDMKVLETETYTIEKELHNDIIKPVEEEVHPPKSDNEKDLQNIKLIVESSKDVKHGILFNIEDEKSLYFQISKDEDMKSFKEMSINLDQTKRPLIKIGTVPGEEYQNICISRLISNEKDNKKYYSEKLIMKIKVDNKGKIIIECIKDSEHEEVIADDINIQPLHSLMHTSQDALNDVLLPSTDNNIIGTINFEHQDFEINTTNEHITVGEISTKLDGRIENIINIEESTKEILPDESSKEQEKNDDVKYVDFLKKLSSVEYESLKDNENLIDVIDTIQEVIPTEREIYLVERSVSNLAERILGSLISAENNTFLTDKLHMYDNSENINEEELQNDLVSLQELHLEKLEDNEFKAISLKTNESIDKPKAEELNTTIFSELLKDKKESSSSFQILDRGSTSWLEKKESIHEEIQVLENQTEYSQKPSICESIMKENPLCEEKQPVLSTVVDIDPDVNLSITKEDKITKEMLKENELSEKEIKEYFDYEDNHFVEENMSPVEVQPPEENIKSTAPHVLEVIVLCDINQDGNEPPEQLSPSFTDINKEQITDLETLGPIIKETYDKKLPIENHESEKENQIVSNLINDEPYFEVENKETQKVLPKENVTLISPPKRISTIDNEYTTVNEIYIDNNKIPAEEIKETSIINEVFNQENKLSENEEILKSEEKKILNEEETDNERNISKDKESLSNKSVITKELSTSVKVTCVNFTITKETESLSETLLKDIIYTSKDKSEKEKSTEFAEEKIPKVIREKISEEKIPEIIEEKSTEFAEEVIPEVMKEKSLETIDENLAEVTEEKNTETIEEKCSEIIKERSTEFGKEIIPEVIEEKISEVIEDKSPEIIKEKSTEIADEIIPEVIEEKISEVIENKSPEIIKEKSTEIADKIIPEVIEEKISEVIEEKSSEFSKENFPYVIEEKISEVIEEKSLETIEEKSTKYAEEIIPEVIPKNISEVIEEKTPEIIEENVTEVIVEKNTEIIKEKLIEFVEEKDPVFIREKISEVIEKNSSDGTSEKILSVIEEKSLEVIKEKSTELVEKIMPEVTREKVSKVMEEKSSEIIKENSAKFTEEKIPDVKGEKVSEVIEKKSPETTNFENLLSDNDEVMDKTVHDESNSLNEDEMKLIESAVKNILEEIRTTILNRGCNHVLLERCMSDELSNELLSKSISYNKEDPERKEDLSNDPIINYTTHSCFNSKAPIKVTHHEEHSHVQIYKSLNPENEYRLTNTSWTKSEIIFPNNKNKPSNKMASAIDKICCNTTLFVLEKVIKKIVTDHLCNTESSVTPFSNPDMFNQGPTSPELSSRNTRPWFPVYINKTYFCQSLPHCSDRCIQTPYGYRNVRDYCARGIPHVCNQHVSKPFTGKSCKTDDGFVIPKDGIFGRDSNEPKFINFCCNTCRMWISLGNRDQHTNECVNNNMKRISTDSSKSKLKPKFFKRMPGKVCYICGGRFTRNTINNHENICLEKWLKVNNQLDKKYRRSPPVKPEFKEKDICQHVNEQVILGNVNYTAEDAVNDFCYLASRKNSINFYN